ncbi:MAG: alpha-glucosidase C-terminal domain-containing protein, partial [Bryocella sp.]
MDAEYGDRMILAEANMWPADVRPYFGDGDECHMAFHFPLMPRIYMAIRQEDRQPITDIMAETPEIPPECQWGLFLRNHDELTLEMVTADERDYMNMAYASDPRMRINVGIRRRLAPLVDNNRRRIELLNSLLFSFPGTPILYYGDEIGMGDNIYLGDRNGVRTPMQWNSDRNAGFSTAVPARLYLPVIMDPIWGYQAINVEAQESDPSSLLHWTRNMIALRELFQVFGRGTLEFLAPENRKILAYIRDFAFEDGHRETVLCVANLSRFAQPVSLDLAKFAGMQPVEMLGYVPFPEISEEPYQMTLTPYSFLWLELQQGAPKVEHPVLDTTTGEGTNNATLPISCNGTTPCINELLTPTGIPLLEALLPQYIAQQRWFGGKSRAMQSAKIQHWLPVAEGNFVIAAVEVSYEDGGHETYRLPLGVTQDQEAERLRKNAPHSVMAVLGDGLQDAVLYDATANEHFHKGLLALFAGSESGGAIGGTHSPAFALSSLGSVESRVMTAEQSNTSIVFDQVAILKLFRRLQLGENPDVEVSRFLTDVAHFHGIPAYMGELHTAGETPSTVAFLQAYAKNEGDGWAWFLEELGRYYESLSNCPAPITIGTRPRFN